MAVSGHESGLKGLDGDSGSGRERPAAGAEVDLGSAVSAKRRRDAALALIEKHDGTLRRRARRFSLCADDAEDAYQRSLEILLTKSPETDGERLLRWMHTVVKHEAFAVRRQRERLLSGNPRSEGVEDPIDLLSSEAPEPTEGAARRERVRRSREALQRLKPNEVTALVLKAEGYSYVEIGQITGWTYTKINRCLAEGRKKFFEVFADIESGRRCDELADQLSALGDGELPEADRPALVEHLRSCAHCRAKLRAYRTVPRQVLAIAPISALALPGFGQRIGDGAAIGIERFREHAFSLLHRGSGEAADSTATQLAVTGGTRGGGLALTAKLMVICLGTAGAGGAYVASGLAPVPGHHKTKPAVERDAGVEANRAVVAPVAPPARVTKRISRPKRHHKKPPVSTAASTGSEFDPGSAPASAVGSSGGGGGQAPLGGGGEFGP